MAADEHTDGYSGPATLTVDGRTLEVQVLLDARHEPQDGRLHWFGRMRLAEGEQTDDLGRARELVLSTPGGRAPASLGDVDPWGRYRITGVGAPPYALDDPEPDDD